MCRGLPVAENLIKAKWNFEPDSRIDKPELSKPLQSYDVSTKKRARESRSDHPSKRRKRESFVGVDTSDPVGHWIQEGRWPGKYFEQDNRTRNELEHGSSSEAVGVKGWLEEQSGQLTNMGDRLAKPKLPPSLRRKGSESSLNTASDQLPREVKSAKYKNPSYETTLALKGSFMDESDMGITDASKILCQTLLDTEQTTPQDSLFRDDLFRKTCRSIHSRNEAMVIRDITLLIVPSAQTLATYGAADLSHLNESVNEGWNSAIPFCGPRPQPDYSVGLGLFSFTDSQLQKLQPFVGEVTDTFTSYFMATWRMYFPFLAAEVKCGAAALDVADRQNAHSATVAVRAVVELYRAVKREKELHREILAFSISHDDRSVRIYGHYALIDQQKTMYYRHLIRTFDFTELDGKEKWTAYKFTKNVYDVFMPLHLKRICSAVDELQTDPDFQVSQQSELQFPEDPGQLSQLSEASVSVLDEQDSQASFIGSEDATPNTSFTEHQFRKPKRRRQK